MSALLRVDALALTPSGPTLTLALEAGRAVAIMGPAAAGKSALLDVLAGTAKPAQGSVRCRCERMLMRGAEWPRRATPESIAKAAAGGAGQRVADALTAARLWDDRRTAVGALSPGQQAALGILPALAARPDLILVDELLDRLDPWTLGTVLELLAQRLASGTSLIVATNRPEFLRRVDTVIVLKAESLVFVGSYDDLERRFPATELTVETERQRGVRALVAPFEVSVTEDTQGITFRAAEGQRLAAKLLLEGYGDVKSVVVRRPSPEDLLRMLLA